MRLTGGKKETGGVAQGVASRVNARAWRLALSGLNPVAAYKSSVRREALGRGQLTSDSST